MGIKRCPSFSKRPGFPCGLRVLLLDVDEAQRKQSEQLLKECSYKVTLCNSTADVVSRLSSSCNYDILLADRASCKSSSETEQLLSSAKGLPCIFTACNPSPEDVMAGVRMGAVDFLAKPLALGKLRNIWQHTVRKMMCNMNITCSDSAAAGLAAADELASPPAGKPRVSMEVIFEEDDLQAAAAAAVAAGAGKPPAAASSPSAATPGSTSNGSVINYSNGPNMALAITSSFYEPSKASAGLCLSRCGSSAMTSWAAEGPTGSGSGGPDSPVMERPTKQQHGHHGAVRSCPSTRSLSSAASCYSSWTMSLPASPSSDGLHKQASDVAAAVEADSFIDDLIAAAEGAPRCMKKAVRHPAAAGTAAHAGAACKPPLAGKPAGQTSAQQQKLAAGTPAASASTGKQASFAGMPSVPLPTGLGPLPQGMVWGMPMCPLVRAPGIVPPTNTSVSAPQAAGMSMAPWGMCSMPMFGAMAPPPFMGSGYGGVMPAMGMAYPAAPGFSTGLAAGMPTGGYMDPCSQQQMAGYAQQQVWANMGEPQSQVAAAAAAHLRSNSAAACTAAPTGAAAAAALDASFTAAELLGGTASTPAAAGAGAMDVAEDDAFDFMLGDITAEDDLPDACGGLLDADLSVLAGGSIKMSRELSSEMQALEADLQQQAAAAAAAAAGRCSFESSAAQRQRVSFDCSTASTCTAARASFEASQRCNSARVSFEVSTRSNRVSFEVNCHNSGKAPTPAVNTSLHATRAAHLNSAASAPAELLGSVSDLFAACSGDSSHGSGLQHVDSCGMLADLPDLQSLFAASGDSSCPQDCADSALTDTAGLFLDSLDDMPIDVGLRKNDSFAELINASLPGLAN